MSGTHIFGLYVFGSLYRFEHVHSEQEFARLTRFGLPAHFCAFHEGTANMDVVRALPVVTWREWKAVMSEDMTLMGDHRTSLPVHPEAYLEHYQARQLVLEELRLARQNGYHYEIRHDGRTRTQHQTRKSAQAALMETVKGWRHADDCTAAKYNPTSYGLKHYNRLVSVINLVRVVHSGEGQ